MTQPSTARRGKSFRDLVNEAKTRIQEVSVEELQAWKTQGKPFLLLDIREPEDFAQGHVPGAVNIPRGILELEIDDLVNNDQDKLIVAYCGGGSRSALATDTLQTMGYSQVYSLAGGFRAASCL